jgi:hypothetical protein
MSSVARPPDVPWWITAISGAIVAVSAAGAVVAIGGIMYYMPKCCCGWWRCWC